MTVTGTELWSVFTNGPLKNRTEVISRCAMNFFSAEEYLPKEEKYNFAGSGRRFKVCRLPKCSHMDAFCQSAFIFRSRNALFLFLRFYISGGFSF